MDVNPCASQLLMEELAAALIPGNNVWKEIERRVSYGLGICKITTGFTN